MDTVQESDTSMNSFPAKLQSKIEMAKSMREDEKLYRYNGVLYPVIIGPEENLKALETVEARSDDIMLVAYPKCGKCENKRQPKEINILLPFWIIKCINI